MKKIILVLSILCMFLTWNVSSVLADSAAFDMDYAGYTVYVMTPDGGLNIRSGPGVEYDKVMNGTIPDYTELYITYTSGNWGYTTYNGYEGWVALKQTVNQLPDKETPEPVIKEETPAETTEETTEEVQDNSEEDTASGIVEMPEPPVKPDVLEPYENEIKGTTEGELAQSDHNGMIGDLIFKVVLIALLVLLIGIVSVLVIVIIITRSRKNK